MSETTFLVCRSLKSKKRSLGIVDELQKIYEQAYQNRHLDIGPLLETNILEREDVLL